MSNTIDERVVELQFDNSDFEKNVKVSMATLDQLKKALNLEGATRGLEKINLAIDNVNFSGMETNINTIAQRFDVLGIMGQRIISNLADSAYKFIAGIGNKFLSGIKNGGWTRAMNIENARFQIQGLKGDWDALYEDMQYGVNDTAYGLDSAAKVAAQLVASGMQAGDSMRTVLRGISGVAAMTNSGYDEIGSIFTTIAGNGKVMTMQLRQLASRGLNAAATLSEYLTNLQGIEVTEQEVYDLVSDGAINFETFAAAMDSAFGEHAKEANKTFSGAMSNIKAAMSKIGANFWSGLIAQEGPLVNFLNAIREKIVAIKELTQDPLINASAALGTKINAIATAINSIQVNENTTKGMSLFVDTLSNIFYFINKIVESLLGGFFEAFDFSSIGGSVVSLLTAINKLSKNLRISDKAANNLKNTFKGLFSILDLVSGILNKVFQVGLTVVSELLNVIFKIIGKLTGVITTITGAIGSLITKIKEWITSNNRLQSIISSLSKILNSFGQIIGSVIKVFAEFINKIKDSPLVHAAAEKAVEAFSKAIETLSGWIEKGADKLSQFMEKLAELNSKNLDSLSSAVHNFVENGLSDLKNFNFNVEAIPENFLTGFANGLKDKAFMIFDIAKTIFTNFVEKVCDVLGIRSPSVVAYEIGNNFMQGWINGMKSTAKEAVAALEQVFSNIIDQLAQVSISDVVVVGSIGTLMYTIKKFGDLITAFQKPAQAFADLLTNTSKIPKAITQGITSFSNVLNAEVIRLGTAGAKWINSKTWTNRAAALRSVAVSLLLVAGAMIALAYVPTDKLIQGGAALAVIAVAISALTLASKGADFKSVAAIGAMMLGMGSALLMISKAMKNIGSLDDRSWAKATISMLTLVSILGIFELLAVKATSSTADMAKVGLMFVGWGVAIKIMASALKSLAKINSNALLNAEAAIVGIITIMGVMTGLIAYFINKSEFSASDEILAIATMFVAWGIALRLIASTIKVLGSMSKSDLTKGTVTIIALEIMMYAMVGITQIDSKNVSQAGTLLLKMAGAMAVMVLVIKLAAGLKLDEVVQGIIVVGMIEVLFAAVIAASYFAGEHASKAGSMLLKMSGAIGIMVGVIYVINCLTPQQIEKGMNTIAQMGLLFAEFLTIGKLLGGKKAVSIGNTLIQIASSILIMSVAIALLSLFDPADITKGVLAIDALMIGLALVAKSTEEARDCTAMFKSMAVTIAALAASVAVLSMLDSKRLAVATGSLTLLLASFAAIIYATGQMMDVKPAIATVGLMATLVAGLAGLLYAMSELKVKNSLENAGVLSTLLLAMTASIKLLQGAKGIDKSMLLDMSLMGLIFLELGVVLATLNAINFDTSIEQCTGLSILLLAMTASLGILGTLKIKMDVAMEAAGAIAAFATILIVVVAALTTAIGAINKESHGAFAEFVNESIPILTDMGRAIGGFFGGIFDGFQQATIDGAIASWQKILNFLNNDLKVSPDVAESAGNMALAIAALTASDLMTKLSAFFGDEEDTTWTDKLTQLGQGMKAFSDEVDGINVEAISAASKAASKLSDLIKVIPRKGGLAGTILGDQEELSTFGLQIVAFATAMITVSGILEKSGGINQEMLSQLAESGTEMANLQSNLARMDGVLQDIFGEQDLAKFGKQIKQFAKAMVKTSNILTENGGINPDAIQTCATAGGYLADLQNNLDNEGGVISWFIGQNNLEEFGKHLVVFGEAMVSFSNSCADIQQEYIEYALAFTDKLKVLSDNAVEGYDLTNLYSVLENLGTKFTDFATTMNTVDWANTSIGLNSITDFGTLLATNLVGKEFDISSFINAINDLKTIDFEGLATAFEDSTNIANSVKTFVDTIINAISNGFTNGATTVKAAATNMITVTVTAIKDTSPNFTEAGKYLMKSFKNGIKSKVDKPKEWFEKACKNAYEAIALYYQSFYEKGAYLIDGFIEGIKSKASTAVTAAGYVAKACSDIVAKTLDERSPSHLLDKMGQFFTLGFANGISGKEAVAVSNAEDLANSTVEAVKSIALAAKDSLADSLGTTLSITPVLDTGTMTNYSWSGLLNGQLANLSFVDEAKSITDMCLEIQNGIISSNNEVVSAIEELRSDLGVYYENSDTEVALYLDSNKITNAMTKNVTRRMSAINKLR